jgi:hypothetical protein
MGGGRGGDLELHLPPVQGRDQPDNHPGPANPPGFDFIHPHFFLQKVYGQIFSLQFWLQFH